MMKNTSKWMFTALALAAASAATAQSAGTWSARAGFTTITPQVTSGDLTAPSFAGTKSDVLSATQVSGGINYMVTDNFSIDVPMGLPFKHDIVGAGAIKGVGKLGDVQSLPITAWGQYHFLAPTAQFRPYVGVGVVYAKFFKAKGTAVLSSLTGGSPTTLSVESKAAGAIQLGGTYAVNDKWFIDASVSKSWLKHRTTLSTGQTIDIAQDPLGFCFAIGRKF